MAFSVWHYVSKKPDTEMLDRVVPVYLSSAIQQSGIKSAMHAQALSVRSGVRHIQLDYASAQSAQA